MGLWIFDWDGESFLQLYIVLIGVSVFLRYGIASTQVHMGREPGILNTEQLSYLTGGPTRFAQSLVARLLASGDLKLDGEKQILIVSANGGSSPAERAILSLPSPTTLELLEQTTAPHAQALEQTLVDAGLLTDRKTALRDQAYQLLPTAMVLIIGITKGVIGIYRDKPIGLLLIFTIIWMVFMRGSFNAYLAPAKRMTKLTATAVKAAQTEKELLRHAPPQEELGLAVALFGVVAVKNSDFQEYYAMDVALHGANTSSIGGDSSGGDSGGDGGGGGCGGCSGGGD